MVVDRLHELERMRRPIAVLQPGTKALDREDAMRLIAEGSGPGAADAGIALSIGRAC
jgi:hypothetical protein